MSGAVLDRHIADLRRFNRFYTQKIGVLEDGLLASRFSLTEARILYELAGAEPQTAARLAGRLGLDRGYLSRILRGFERRGLLRRTPSAADRRLSLLELTPQGRAAFAELDDRSQAAIGTLLRSLTENAQTRLVAAAQTIERTLGATSDDDARCRLRPHRPGDIGWIISRHGALYAQEYGWDIQFEALVAEIAANFLRGFNPHREFCRIAEKGGENIGSVMLVKDTDRVAKLRLLLVEPDVRGLGIGARLVQECLHFAKAAGYAKITLWTNSILVAARHLYKNAGFQMVAAQPHHSFGHDLIGENWELVL